MAKKRIMVTVEYDRDCDSPLYNDPVELYSFNGEFDEVATKEKFFTHFDRRRNMWIDGPSIGLRRKLQCGTAVLITHETHGPQCDFRLYQGDWTENPSGILLYTGNPKDIGDTCDKRIEVLKGILKDHTEWSNGGAYMCKVKDREGLVNWDLDWERGHNYQSLKEDLELALKGIDKSDIKWRGEAAHAFS